ncbi:hypothetical protein ABTZ98_32180 [Streptomyces bacillaris]
MTDQVRDGLPTAEEIRQACKLLQIPLDEKHMGIESMTGERQVTALLAVLAAWVNCYQTVNDYNHDRLSLDEVRMLVASAESEVWPFVEGEESLTAIAAMNSALWRIQWAALTIQEIGRSPHALNPSEGIAALLRAAGCLITEWREAHGQPGFILDGHTFSTSKGEYALQARREIRTAQDVITRIVGPPKKRK